ncbi:uncharacterized protein [Macrobrachium rosenbergii]|uniref:uncharacterized protein n=1 Tax=Macrobrachium rosenbergii TaxID=79674 RepID=UPI0034D756CA
MLKPPSTEKVPNQAGGRIIALTWLIATLVFMKSYSGILTAMLTLPKVHIPIDSLADLVAQDKIPWRIVGGTFLNKFFQESPDPVYRKVYEGLQGFIPSCSEASEDIVNGKFVTLCNTISISRIIWNYFSVLALVESGLSEKWFHKNVPKPPECYRSPSQDHSDSIAALNIEALGGPFIILIGGNVVSKEAAFECGKQCLVTSGCHSFVLRPRSQECYLTRFDLCAEGASLLKVAYGYYFYDVRPGEFPANSATCFQNCNIQKKNCSLCGRPNCLGSRCEECFSYCWELHRYEHERDQVLWIDNKFPVHRTCKGEWERFWRSDSRDLAFEAPPYPIELRVALISDQQEVIADAYFDSVRVTNRLLSVGDYTRGKASNFWGAPFVDRKLTYFSDSTCKGFFYPKMDSCRANGAKEVDAVRNQVKTAGFSWISGDKEIDDQVVSRIDFWVRRV